MLTQICGIVNGQFRELYVASLEEIIGEKGGDLRWQATLLIQIAFADGPG
jgi:hypothetical protein